MLADARSGPDVGGGQKFVISLRMLILFAVANLLVNLFGLTLMLFSQFQCFPVCPLNFVGPSVLCCGGTTQNWEGTLKHFPAFCSPTSNTRQRL